MPYRVFGSSLTAVGRSQLLARWPGTHSRILTRIHRAAQTVLVVYLKRTCSRVTSASSALGVLNDYALYKSTPALTHSLTHCSRDAQPVPKAVYRSSRRDNTAFRGVIRTLVLSPPNTGRWSPHPKRHLDRSSRFCRARDCVQQTHRQTDTYTNHGTSVTKVITCSFLFQHISRECDWTDYTCMAPMRPCVE